MSIYYTLFYNVQHDHQGAGRHTGTLGAYIITLDFNNKSVSMVYYINESLIRDSISIASSSLLLAILQTISHTFKPTYP